MLSFFSNRIMDVQNLIFDPILTKHKNNKVIDKDFNGIYKLIFQSNSRIGSKLNLDQKH